jgi:hypothetical protein
MYFRTKRAAWCQIAMLLVFSGASCVMLKRPKDRGDSVAPELKAKVIGSVYMVREELGFVLIKTVAVRLPKGYKLDIKRHGSSTIVAELLVGPEKKQGFIVADILSGHPEKGDLAFPALSQARGNDSGGVKIPALNGIPTKTRLP